MRIAALSALALLFSCSDPVCGCSPRQAGVVLTGVLRTSAGTPRPGMLVRGVVAQGVCDAYIPVGGGDVSAPDGRVSLRLYATPVDSLCVRLSAQDTLAGSPVIVLPGIVRVHGRYEPYDTVGVDLTLPP